MIEKSEIEKKLEFDVILNIIDEISSTNSALKELAENGAAEWTVLCAFRQTAGRGRTGKSFYSPENGIYFSIILKPELKIYDSLYITVIAACAVVRAIKKLTNKEVKIKWVNDIYNDKGKICGILTESAVNFNDNTLKYAVLGIGLNVFPPKDGFPDDISNIASSLFERGESEPYIKECLIAEIINQIHNLIENFDIESLVGEYKDNSLLIGKEISYTQNGHNYIGKVTDIDSNCNLVVKDNNENLTYLSSGEVTLTQW